MIPGRRLQRKRDGQVRLRLTRAERELLAGLALELGEHLDEETDAPDLARLFPPAYEENPAGEAEYRMLMHEELLDGKRDALRLFVESLEHEELSEEELETWTRVLNDFRLVLGTRLGVTEGTLVSGLDAADPDARELALYGYLSWLQEQAVEAAVASLPRR